MNIVFDLEVRQPCPHARVVYDLFQVMAKYGREVMDRDGWMRPISYATTNRRAGSSSRYAGCRCAIRKTCASANCRSTCKNS
ncbi:hypothetical protein FQZ97_1276450 [compost metagenome]